MALTIYLTHANSNCNFSKKCWSILLFISCIFYFNKKICDFIAKKLFNILEETSVSVTAVRFTIIGINNIEQLGK